MALTEQERLYLENALEQISLAEAAAGALRYSYQHRPEIGGDRTDKAYDDAEWERSQPDRARMRGRAPVAVAAGRRPTCTRAVGLCAAGEGVRPHRPRKIAGIRRLTASLLERCYALPNSE